MSIASELLDFVIYFWNLNKFVYLLMFDPCLVLIEFKAYEKF